MQFGVTPAAQLPERLGVALQSGLARRIAPSAEGTEHGTHLRAVTADGFLYLGPRNAREEQVCRPRGQRDLDLIDTDPRRMGELRQCARQGLRHPAVLGVEVQGGRCIDPGWTGSGYEVHEGCHEGFCAPLTLGEAQEVKLRVETCRGRLDFLLPFSSHDLGIESVSRRAPTIGHAEDLYPVTGSAMSENGARAASDLIIGMGRDHQSVAFSSELFAGHDATRCRQASRGGTEGGCPDLLKSSLR